MGTDPGRGRLAGRVVVVNDPDAARAVTESGGAVVVVSSDDAAGAVVAELGQEGHRVAHFSGELTDIDDRAALGEMLAELFPPDSTVEPA